jgi:hypothetical protein
MPDLEALAMAPPQQLPAEIGDTGDPRPWLEAYDAGVGSPLELKFLRLFEQNGVAVEKQVPVGPEADGPPISQADFRVVGTNVLVYVDGAAFHAGSRLRRDRAIRKALQAGPAGWRVVEVTARDLAHPDQILRRLGADEDPLDELRRQTRSEKAIAIAEALYARMRAEGEKPLGLNDAIGIAVGIDADHGEALLAIERLAQSGLIRRVFLDMTKDPPAPMSWDEVLDRLGGREGLAGETWREAARGIAVQWLPAGRRRT